MRQGDRWNEEEIGSGEEEEEDGEGGRKGRGRVGAGVGEKAARRNDMERLHGKVQ